MRKRLLCVILSLAIISYPGGGWANTLGKSKDVSVDVSGFNKNLGPNDTNVQHALSTLDQLIASGGGNGSVNWGNITGLITNQNWLSPSAFLGRAAMDWTTLNKDISRTGVNWTSLNNDLQRAAVNWTSLNNDIQRAGINWTSLNKDIQVAGINWISLNKTLQNYMVNWASLNQDLQRAAINWQALNGDISKGAINWTDINVSGIMKGQGSSSPTAAVAGTDYVAPNNAITGATNTKITYDTKGLVTAGAAATTADIADSTDKRYVTDAQRTVIQNTSGTNTGDVTLAGQTYLTIAGQVITAKQLASANINWTDVKNLEMQRAGINWSSLSKDISSAAINWGNINAAIQRGNINWTSLVADIQRYGINWSSLNADVTAKGINWLSLPVTNIGATSGQIFIGDNASGGMALGTLTAGSGIVITNGPYTSTIAASGTVTPIAAGNNGAIQYNNNGPQAGANNTFVDSNSNIGIGTTSAINAPLVVFGNVGIGSNTPQSKLDVVGAATATSFQLSGTNAFQWGSPNGIQFDGAHLTPSAFGLAIDTANNVGIGTTTTISLLTVKGNTILSGGSANYLNFNTTAGTSGYGFRDNAGTMEFKNSGGSWTGVGTGGGGSGTITSSTANQVPVFTASTTIAGTNNLVVNGSNVGIGSTAPGALLDVFGTVRIGNSGNLTVAGNETVTGTMGVTSTTLLTGNVGIGTTSLASPLTVQGTVTINGSSGDSYLVSGAGNLGIGTSAPITFLDANRLFNVTSAGNVGIGSTAPGASLDVNGTVKIRAILITSGTAPAVATGSGDCGTSPSISGNDLRGAVTVGSSTNGGKCTLTFNVARSTTPSCFCNNRTTGNLCRGASPSTTTVALTGTLTAADVIDYWCPQ